MDAKQLTHKTAAIFLLLGMCGFGTASFSESVLKPEGEGVPIRFTYRPLEARNQALSGSVGFPWPASRYDIVIPERSTTQDQKAAYELAFWLGEITGAVFPVITDDQAKQRPEISIGKTARLTLSGIDISGTDLGEEGYAIAVKGDDLFLYGGARRGPIYAVFALLEEDLGCRWYSYRATEIPRTTVLEADIVPRQYVPPFVGREPFNWHSLWPGWAFRNRLNAPQVPIPDVWGGYPRWAARSHNFLQLVPPKTYLESHPEYYGITPEKIPDFRRRGSYLSLAHPDVLEIVIDSVRRILAADPEARYMMIAPEDDAVPTRDLWSQAFYESVEDNPSALLIHFVNQVAERLENEFPEVVFVTYAYQATMQPPERIRPRHNVGVRLTNVAHARLPFTSVADHHAFKDLLDGWSAICDHIFIYDYWGNFLHLLAPAPMFELIASNIRYFAARGVEEVSGTHTVTRARGAGDRDAMRSWVISKLLWNPEWDVIRLIEEFCHGYYGPAGEAMAAYNRILRESLAEHLNEMMAVGGEIFNRNYPMNVAMFNKAFMEEATALFEEALLQVRGDPERTERVFLDSLSIAYVKLMQGPEVWGREAYQNLIDRYEARLLLHLENTRFARPWHEGEAPDQWRTYWRRKLDEYIRAGGGQ